MSSDPGDPLPPVAEQARLYDVRARALSQANGLRPAATLAYGPDVRQRIEVYRPADTAPETPLPVLVFLHGGAWIAGGFEWLRFMAGAVTAQPAILAAVTYRLAPDHRWPAQLDDTTAAIRLIQREVAGLGGDPGRLVVAGHSAGGHLAAMAVLAGDIAPVRACMPVSGPMDLRYGCPPSETGKGRVYRYLLARPEDDAGASPICALAGNRVPFHLTWGASDFDHILEAAPRMVAALRAAGQPVDCRIVPGAGHFDTHLTLRDPQDDWYRAFRAFVA